MAFIDRGDGVVAIYLDDIIISGKCPEKCVGCNIISIIQDATGRFYVEDTGILL